ncbi:hypothetical protein MMC07_009157 [Pseudocyphellaria aurata]|nr:hypothetical protein [Pseudocyphellaria aurata]
MSEVGIRLTEADQATKAIIDDNLNGERGHWGYVAELHDRTVEAMNLGKGLDEMTNTMMTEIAAHLEASSDDFCKNTVHLHAWSRHLLTMCGTTALYGSNSPFITDPRLEKAFWNFEAGLNLLLLNIYPALIARNAHNGRRKLADAFRRYFETDPTGKSSALTEARYSINRKFGLSTANMGRLEVGSLLGVLVNTVPGLVYLLYHVFSDQSLLRDIRAELDSIISKDGSAKLLILDISVLKEKSHLLLSTFQEVLRVYARGASARVVMEDTVLNNQYLLKKGAVLMMPQSVIHSDPSVWGPTDFQARRFLKHDSVAQASAKRSSAASYRPFGGGSTICPGRHFATAELLGLAAMMIHRYELRPARGPWRPPTPRQTSWATNIFPPQHDIEVQIRTRPGMEDVRWTFP